IRSILERIERIHESTVVEHDVLAGMVLQQLVKLFLVGFDISVQFRHDGAPKLCVHNHEPKDSKTPMTDTCTKSRIGASRSVLKARRDRNNGPSLTHA